MQLYAIFQEGVYRHSCFGIFSTEQEAKDHAIQVALSDRDSYHEYTVVPFTLNQPLLFDYDSAYAAEPTKIFTTKP